MRQAKDIAAFLEQPIGSWVSGRRWLVHCPAPSLMALLAWERGSRQDADQVMDTFLRTSPSVRTPTSSTRAGWTRSPIRTDLPHSSSGCFRNGTSIAGTSPAARSFFPRESRLRPWSASSAWRRRLSRRLASTELKITAVALEVGCASSQHLSALFRKMTGQSPRAWRATHR
jgi:hypothetical protein